MRVFFIQRYLGITSAGEMRLAVDVSEFWAVKDQTATLKFQLSSATSFLVTNPYS